MKRSSDWVLSAEYICDFIKTGQEHAERLLSDAAHKKGAALTAQDMAEKFNQLFDDVFVRMTRHDGTILELQIQKHLLKGAIECAAALCRVAKNIRNYPDAKTKAEATDSLLNGKKDFYEHHSNSELQPRVIAALDAYLSRTIPDNMARIEQRRELMIALKSMFPKSGTTKEPSISAPDRAGYTHTTTTLQRFSARSLA